MEANNNRHKEALANTDRTSWTRVAMVINYLLTAKRTRKIFLYFPLVSILLFALTYFTARHSMPTDGLTGLLIYFVALAPLVFVKPDSRETFYTLPALGLEKIIAVFVCCLIIIPIMILAPSEILGQIVYGPESSGLALFFSNKVAIEGSYMDFDNFVIYTILYYLSMLLTVMWGVFGAKNGKSMWGVLGFFAIFFSQVIILIGITLFLVLTEHFQNELELQLRIFECMKYLSIFWGIYAVFVISRICLSISRKQI